MEGLEEFSTVTSVKDEEDFSLSILPIYLDLISPLWPCIGYIIVRGRKEEREGLWGWHLVSLCSQPARCVMCVSLNAGWWDREQRVSLFMAPAFAAGGPDSWSFHLTLVRSPVSSALDSFLKMLFQKLLEKRIQLHENKVQLSSTKLALLVKIFILNKFNFCTAVSM